MPTFNLDLHNQIIAKIEAEPENWNQAKWHCGTAHCYGGWAQILSGMPINTEFARRDARMALGLSVYEADALFDSVNDLQFLKMSPTNILKYGASGYNRYGYDISDNDRNGSSKTDWSCRNRRDSEGYDVDGLDINNNPKPSKQEGAI